MGSAHPGGHELQLRHDRGVDQVPVHHQADLHGVGGEGQEVRESTDCKAAGRQLQAPTCGCLTSLPSSQELPPLPVLWLPLLLLGPVPSPKRASPGGHAVPLVGVRCLLSLPPSLPQSWSPIFPRLCPGPGRPLPSTPQLTQPSLAFLLFSPCHQSPPSSSVLCEGRGPASSLTVPHHVPAFGGLRLAPLLDIVFPIHYGFHTP